MKSTESRSNVLYTDFINGIHCIADSNGLMSYDYFEPPQLRTMAIFSEDHKKGTK